MVLRKRISVCDFIIYAQAFCVCDIEIRFTLSFQCSSKLHEAITLNDDEAYALKRVVLNTRLSHKTDKTDRFNLYYIFFLPALVCLLGTG